MGHDIVETEVQTLVMVIFVRNVMIEKHLCYTTLYSTSTTSTVTSVTSALELEV